MCVCVCVQDFILCLPPFLSLCLLVGIALSPSSCQFRDIYTSLIVKKKINDIVFNYKVFNRYFLLDEIKKYNIYLPLICCNITTCFHDLQLHLLNLDLSQLLFLTGSKGIFLIILRCFVKRYLCIFFSIKNLVFQ